LTASSRLRYPPPTGASRGEKGGTLGAARRHGARLHGFEGHQREDHDPWVRQSAPGRQQPDRRRPRRESARRDHRRVASALRPGGTPRPAAMSCGRRPSAFGAPRAATPDTGRVPGEVSNTSRRAEARGGCGEAPSSGNATWNGSWGARVIGACQRAREARASQSASAGGGTIEGAVFWLMGLLLAFTFMRLSALSARGEAGPGQIADPQLGLTHNLGGMPGKCVSFVPIVGR